MKFLIGCLFALFIGATSSFANCCCDVQIQLKIDMVDNYLKTKNESNEKALDELIDKIKDLNQNIFPNRINEIKDYNLKAEIDKFNMNSAKNLFHANSMPNGLLYYQLVKNGQIKDEVIESLSSHTDLILLNSKTNLESLKNSIYNAQIKQAPMIEKDTEEVFNKK